MRYVSSILGLPTCAGFVLVSSILGLTLSTPQLTSVLTSSTSGCPRTGLSGVAAAVGVVYYCTIKSTSRQWNWIKSEMLRRKSVSGPEPDSKPKQTTSSWKTRPHFQLAVMSWAAGRDQFVRVFTTRSVSGLTTSWNVTTHCSLREDSLYFTCEKLVCVSVTGSAKSRNPDTAGFTPK